MGAALVLLLLRWLLVYAVLIAAALPIARLLFPSAPDGGAGLALPVAVVPVTLSAFYLGHARFGPWTALASLCLLVACGAVAHRLVRRRGLGYDRRKVGEACLAFAVGFSVLLLFRAAAPTVTPAGGEQFLHFGLYRAVLRAESLPPTDMWYAGETVRYYFGLPTFNATLTLLAGVEARYGYNFLLPGYFGALVAAAYSLSGWLAADWGRSRRLGGVLGAFFVAFAGNLATAARLAFGQLPRDVALAYGEPVFGAIRHLDYPEAVASQGSPGEWFWFYERYVVPGTLQEFPLYSFIKADVHGHTVTTPLLVLTAALGYAVYRAPPTARWRRRGLTFLALPLVGGYFGVTNTWSLPTVAGVAWLALLFGGAAPAGLLPTRLVGDGSGGTGGQSAGAAGPTTAGLRSELRRAALATAAAVVVGGLSVAVAAPFLLYGTPTNEGIGLFPPRTEAAGLLLLYGGFLGLFWLHLAARLPDRRWIAAGVALLPAAVAFAWAAGDLAAFVLLCPPLVAAAVLLRAGFRPWSRLPSRSPSRSGEASSGTGPTGTAAARGVGYGTVLLVAGLGLVLSMELVHARVAPWNRARWNTTLKVAIQAWVLCGLAAGPIAARLLGEARGALPALPSRSGTGTEGGAGAGSAADRARSDGGTGSSDGGTAVRLPSGTAAAAAAVAVVVLVAALLVASGLFGALAAGNELDAGLVAPGGTGPTVDAMAGHERWRSDEVAAIAWLDRTASDEQRALWMRRHVGTPTIVEAPGTRTYTWANPAATFTGLPAVAGWAHQENYRGEAAYERRVAAVDAIMRGDWDAAEPALARYDVAYVYVGPAERERYGDDLADFRGHPAFTVAFENDAVTIYRVDPAAVDALTASARPAPPDPAAVARPGRGERSFQVAQRRRVV